MSSALRDSWASGVLPLCLSMLLVASAVAAERREAAEGVQAEVSPALRIQRTDEQRLPPGPAQKASDVRSSDGSGNHPRLRTLGQARQPLRRLAPPAYADGWQAMAGHDRPGPRAISNAVHAQSAPIPNRHRLSDLFWQWGQFLDHDIDLTDGTDPPEPAAIPVPLGDLQFDPGSTGSAIIVFNRSRYAVAGLQGARSPRQQVNEISNWIDASQVYGSSDERQRQLRRLDGSGELRSSAGDLLPTSLDAADTQGTPYEFFAGDVRVNEQVGLAAMHTLFMREHNFQARRLRALNPGWDDERLFQAARSIVAAEMQAITYREFLPLLLGADALPAYSGYRPTPDAAIANEFSTAAFRLGHTLLSPILLRLDADGNEIPHGHLSLFDAFFAPVRLRDEGGIDPILRGLTAQVCQDLDEQIIDEVRNFLFGLPGAGGFDLAALNIQRGRDHGLPGYNAVRQAINLPKAIDFTDVSSSDSVRQKLATAYADVHQVDLWTGALAEDPLPGALVGRTLYRIVRDQFIALRDGDRFWWEHDLPPDTRAMVASTRLIDILRRNTGIGTEVDDDPWHADAVAASTRQ